MTMMDERVAARRRGVSEDRARRRLRIVLVILAIVLVTVGAAWLVRSPVLSVSAVEISGAVESDPMQAVDALGFGVGTPTMDVRAAAIRTAIEADPWLDVAVVSVQWPGTIVIDVSEHVPLAPVIGDGSWYLVSASGAVIEATEAPAPGEMAIAIDLAGVQVGSASEDPMILGAAAFLEALPGDLRAGAVMSVDSGSLMASVAGHAVRLGRPIDMYQKAVVLTEMLTLDLEPGAVIDLIAPSRPAVSNSQPQVETEE